MRKFYFFLILSLATLGNIPSIADSDHEPFTYEEVEIERKAAEQGNRNAQYNMGYVYYHGEGVAQDYHKAIYWFRKASKQGEADAQTYLGIMYENGEGVSKNNVEAVKWFRQSAKQGNMWGQFNLGWMYENGNGVPQNKIAAVHWFQEAAEQGLADAQNLLGEAYYYGESIAKDWSKSVEWYRKAANQGHADGQYSLGYMYYNGEGVTKDQREGVRWYLKASEQGQPDAQNALGVAYWEGAGIAENNSEAYIWWSIAKENGNKDAAVNLRGDWSAYLSEAEIHAAKKEIARRMGVSQEQQKIFEENSPTHAKVTIASAPKITNIAAKVFESAWRSVVVVHNGYSQGSGVIVNPDIVATNCHVVDRRDKIIVYKSHNRRADTDTAFSATVHHSDQDKDFCLLHVSGLEGVSTAIRRYNTLRVGESTYALGAPDGYDLSLSDGLISQLRESGDSRFIQTNAAISPGSSGGGLFDSEGNLIGITTEKIAEVGVEGIGFAIPADLILEFLQY